MLDEKQKKQSREIIRQLINENKLVKPAAGTESFFMEKAVSSLKLSRKIFEISEDSSNNLNAYMWVINTSYYSMFFAATSLLAHFSRKVDSDVGIHKLTYHALVYFFFIEDNKLQKHFIEQYKESYEDAEQLLQTSEARAIEMIEHFSFEQSKRSRFTYEVGKTAERNKALTSLNRAEEFLIEIRKMIGR